jgi:peroxiredoxin
MGGMKKFVTLSIFLMFSFFGCATPQPKIPMDWASSQPGTQVSFRGNPVKLLGSPISVGKPLPSVEVVDAMSMKNVDLSKERGSVLLVSIVPSLDTPVCEEQTHYLGEKGNKLPVGIKRIVINRDTPFVQKRFAKEAKLTNVIHSLLDNLKERTGPSASSRSAGAPDVCPRFHHGKRDAYARACVPEDRYGNLRLPSISFSERKGNGEEH